MVKQEVKYKFGAIFSSKDVISSEPLYPSGLSDPSMCAANGKFIYLTGGLIDPAAGMTTYEMDTHTILADCHRYDIQTNFWQKMQPMN